MRITALKNATHVEVTKFTPEKERTYYIWVTKDQRGKEVLATKQVAIAANPHKVDGWRLRSSIPKVCSRQPSSRRLRSLRRTPTLPTSRSVAVSYQPMGPPTWPVSASMPTSRVSLSTMAKKC